MNRRISIAFILLALSSLQQAALAFITVYNVPPDVPPSLIGSDTQVNVFSGGVLNNPDFSASAAQPSELNVYGGSILGSVIGSTVLRNTTANIYDGVITAGLDVQETGVVNLYGGALRGIGLFGGATANLHGGNLTGRRIGSSSNGNTVNVYGAEFQNFSGSVSTGHTGVLEDGSVYIFERTGSFTFTLNLIPSPVPPVGSLVVNAPTDPIPKGLRSGQSLNLAAGGVVEDYFNAVNSTINITGGSIGNDLATAGTNVALNSGTIGDRFVTYAGTTVNINGGHVGSAFTIARGTVNLHGGSIGHSAQVRNNAVVNIDGGSIGDGFTSRSTTQVNMMGGEFLLDGAPVSGPTFLPLTTSYLTGTLADGSVFIFSASAGDGDNFDRSGATRSLNLVSAAVPPVGSVVINAPIDTVPKGLRAGQTLNLGVGASIPNLFAAVSATMNVNGGTVGNDVEVLGTQVTINSGTVGDDFEIHPGSSIVMNGGSVGHDLGLFPNTSLELNAGTIGDSFATRGNVTINGGEIGDDFDNASTTTVTINGGKIGDSYGAGGTVHFAGGSIGDNLVVAAVNFNMTGGEIGDQTLNGFNSRLRISGGTFGQEYWGTENSDLFLTGGVFQKDGVNVSGSSVNLEQYGVFSGVLADGNVFILSSHIGDRFDRFASPSLTQVSVPPVGAAIINAPSDTIPKGLRAGQTLNLAPGGQVQVNFAAIDATINVNGGEVGKGLELLRSTLTLNAGAIADRFAAHAGSVVSILDGTVGDKLFAGPGSIVNIHGGTIGNNAVAKQGSHVIIEGGVIGDNFLADVQSKVDIISGSVGANFSAELASSVTISGGSIGSGFNALRNSIVHIGGGTRGSDFTAVNGANVRLFGSQFEIRDLITGTLIDDLDADMSLGDTLEIDLRNVTLSGILADNTPFSFDLHSVDGLGDFFDAGANLSITLSELVSPPDIPEPSSLMILLAGLIVGGRTRQRIAQQ